MSELSALDAAAQRMRALLAHVGLPGQCKGCAARIIWVRHIDSGRNTPYDGDGTNHFITCPEAAKFKREKANATNRKGP